MRKLEYKKMSEREETYWWHLGRLDIISTYIESFAKGRKDLSILNVGCGTGGTVSTLEKFGNVENVDVSEDALEFMKKKGYTKLHKITGPDLPFKAKTFDLVVAFDVLEHIEDDRQALSEWKRVMKDDGAIVITVPAYQWLWTAHDTALHHYRRYTISMLKSKAIKAGLKPVKKSYSFVFSLPLVVGFRMKNKLLRKKVDQDTSYVDLPDRVNKLFTNLIRIEAWFHRFIRFPAGTSVVAILKAIDV